MKSQVIITGANRGIGLELVRQYLAQKHKVLATVRQVRESTELSSLLLQYPKLLTVTSLDLSDQQSIEDFATAIKENGVSIDLLINNAGYLDRKNESIQHIDFKSAQTALLVNALGPLYLIHQLLAQLNSNHAKIAVISSDMGSFTIEQRVAWYGYRMSKASVNMLVHNLSAELETQAAAVFAIHPGWVKTDMGGEQANLTVTDSARGIMQSLNKLSKKQCGGFYEFSGKALTF